MAIRNVNMLIAKKTYILPENVPEFFAYDNLSPKELLNELNTRYNIPMWYATQLNKQQMINMCELRYIVTQKTGYMEVHEKNVGDLMGLVGPRLGIEGDTLKELQLDCLLHDIGKVIIGKKLLAEEFKDTSSPEYQEFKTLIVFHPGQSGEIFQTFPVIDKHWKIVRAHHERWDGGEKAYPDHLKGEEIPYFARVLSILDSYDAMVGNRSYRIPLTKDQAIIELLKNAGTQFDPDLAYKIAGALTLIKQTGVSSYKANQK